MNDVKFPSLTPKNFLLGVIAVMLFLFVYSVTSSMMKHSSVSSLGLSAGDSVMIAPSYSQGEKGFAGALPSVAFDGAYNEGYAVLERSKGGVTSSFMPSPVPSTPPLGDAKLVKSSYLALLVKNMDEAVAGITAVRTELGGQAGNASFTEYERGVKTGSVTIWVPSARFDEAVAQIKKLALRVENDNTTVSDVSAQYVDLAARLKNLKAAEAQYVEIMKRSGKISEVLEVTRELNNTRSQIEQIQGQLDYLSRQIDLSSITIALREEASPGSGTNEWRPLGVVKEAMKKTIEDFTHFVDLLLIFLVNLPMLLLVIAFWCLIVWVLWRGLRVLHKRLYQAFSVPPTTSSNPSASQKGKV